MTDNRTRTVAEVRHAFAKNGGNLGQEGSVAFMFKHCGQFVFAPGTAEDAVMEAALEAGAEDVATDDEGVIEVIRSEEHTSELQSLMRISYAVFCLKKKTIKTLIKEEHKQT